MWMVDNRSSQGTARKRGMLNKSHWVCALCLLHCCGNVYLREIYRPLPRNPHLLDPFCNYHHHHYSGLSPHWECPNTFSWWASWRKSRDTALLIVRASLTQEAEHSSCLRACFQAARTTKSQLAPECINSLAIATNPAWNSAKQGCVARRKILKIWIRTILQKQTDNRLFCHRL